MRAITIALALLWVTPTFAQSQEIPPKKLPETQPAQQEKTKRSSQEVEDAFFAPNLLDPDLVSPAEVATTEAPAEAPDPKQRADELKEAKQKNKEGLALLQQKKFYEACKAFYFATVLDPKNAHYHNSYGLALLNSREEYSSAIAKFTLALDAVREFESALELGLNKASVWNNLGMAYEHTNQLDKARSAYSKAVKQGSATAKENYQRLKDLREPVPTEIKRPTICGCGGCFTEQSDTLPEVWKTLTLEDLFPSLQTPLSKPK